MYNRDPCTVRLSHKDRASSACGSSFYHSAFTSGEAATAEQHLGALMVLSKHRTKDEIDPPSI